MSDSKLNIELFKKVRERIATIPESYDQGDWCGVSAKAPCGTAACLAGEAIICDAPTVEEGIRRLKQLMRQDEYAVPREAARLLGLTGDPEECLGYSADAGETQIFDPYAEGWPEKFLERFKAGDQAGAAVAYLDHIIETGKVLE